MTWGYSWETKFDFLEAKLYMHAVPEIEDKKFSTHAKISL